MAIRLTDYGVKFDSTSRLLGKYSPSGVPAFVVGQLWGCLKEDATGILFLRPISELTESEREELGDYMIRVWTRFKEPLLSE